MVLLVLLLVLVIAWVTTAGLRLTAAANAGGANEHFGDYDAGADPFQPYNNAVLATYQAVHHTSPDAIYDTDYAQLYRQIIDDPKYKLVRFEAEDFVTRTEIDAYGSKAVLVDIGCGTGAHLEQLREIASAVTLYGLDQSTAMLRAAEARMAAKEGGDDTRSAPSAERSIPRVQFLEGDLNDPNALYEGMCTHLTCYYFSFYYADSSEIFFQNAHRWLQSKGYLVVHLVDPIMFDPVPEIANPMRGVSLQRYFPKRKNDAKIVLRSARGARYDTDANPVTRLYTCQFDHDPATQAATVRETIIDPRAKRVRYHTTALTMPHHEAVVQSARQNGFLLRHVTHLVEIGDEYEYLCYLQRAS